MKMHWRDIDKRLEPGTWERLCFSVSERLAAGFAVSVCRPSCIRLSIGDLPVLWARVGDDYYGYEVLRARTAESRGIVPPIPFGVADEIAAQAPDSAMRSWARHFAQALAESPNSPLSDGEWSMHAGVDWGEHSTLSARDIAGILTHESREYVDWDHVEVRPLPLRDMSPENSGRVKAWRKLARRDELPPVLLYWISGLVASVVLDGHDRLLAAHLEGKPIRALTLGRFYETSRQAEAQQTIWQAVGMAFEHWDRTENHPQGDRRFGAEKANRILLDAFTPYRMQGPTIATQLDGGYERWQAEVRAEARHQGVDLDGLVDDIGSSHFGP